MSVRYVQIAVPVPLPQLFTYILPEGVEAAPGCRVRVSFARRRLVGVVVEGPVESPPGDLDPARVKPVDAVLDETPSLDRSLLELCRFLGAYYHLPPGEAWLLPLPPGLAGAAVRSRVFKEERVARLVRDAGSNERLGGKMLAVVEWLREAGGEVPARILEAETGAGLETLRRLERKGLLALDDRRLVRDPFTGMPAESSPIPEPTPAQARAIEAIRETFGRYQGHLLMGVTGSGKTEVYLRLIAEVSESGKGAIVLVPEIALTPQLVGRFRGRLGERIAVLHSALDPAARTEQWVRIAKGELSVVIGARSALFAPVRDLGILIVDEEHESSFKQDSTPRYHARDLALVRGQLASCPVVLGTATPSVESWANAERGKLTRLVLAERVRERPLPEVELVDLRTADLHDDAGVFSTRLLEAVRENVAKGEQTILLLNRRGFAAFVLCRACGEALSCPDCSVSYTWHRARRRLVCHYCDRVELLPPRCPACDDDLLQEVGFGTEQVEAVLREAVPEARVSRMDRDTTRGHALPRLLQRFRAREIDVLVGTQMVAKGHDFPGVTLVGVLLAEMGLRLPDFRAAERTFQLMTQIAGRAGRAERLGRVLIQTYVPQHYALRHAIVHDATSFLDEERRRRWERGFPPWTHLALLRVSGPDRDATRYAAERLAHGLRSAAAHAGTAESRPLVLGPQVAPIERIRGLFRFQVLLKGPDRKLLGEVLDAGRDAPEAPKGVQVSLDVDPYTFL